MAARPATTTPRRWPSPATSAPPRKKHAPWKASAAATSTTATPAKAPPACEQALAIYQRIGAPAARRVQETLLQLRQDNLAPAPER